MGFFINENQNFSGNAADLANLASQCTRYLNLPGDLDKINERIVRYYVAEGLVGRPERIGRDAQYGYKHLLQFLAGRFFVERGYPMQMVAPYLESESLEKLEILLTTKNLPNKAEFLVATFKRGGVERRSSAERILTRDVDSRKRDVRKMDRSDEDRSDSLQSMSLPSSSIPSAFSKRESLSEMHSVDMSMHSIASASARDPFDQLQSELQSQIRDLHDSIQNQLQSQIRDLHDSMQNQINRVRSEVQDERARLREDLEHERLDRLKEREALQEKINQLNTIVAKQSKGKENE